MTKYRVKTKALKEFEYGQVLTEPDNDGWYYDSDGFEGLKIDVIKRNSDWFEKIEPEVKEGQYWKWGAGNYRVGDIHSDRECFIKNISDEDKFSIPMKILIRDGEILSGKEIEQALIKEANRRGFNGVGLKYRDANDGHKETVGHHWYSSVRLRYVSTMHHPDGLTDGCGGWVYYRGNWAETIEDEWKPVQFGESGKYKVETEDRRIMGVFGKRINQK